MAYIMAYPWPTPRFVATCFLPKETTQWQGLGIELLTLKSEV